MLSSIKEQYLRYCFDEWFSGMFQIENASKEIGKNDDLIIDYLWQSYRDGYIQKMKDDENGWIFE